MPEILAKLEARIARHEQVAFHKQRGGHHREQSATHAAELDKVRRHFESFQPAALPAADLAGPVAPAPARVEEPEDLRELVGKRITASKLTVRVIPGYAEGETFGASRVTAETSRRFSDQLKRPVDARTVSTVLRSLRDAGELYQVRPGSATHEAVYSRGGRGRG